MNKEIKPIITVYTPTYNRGYCLHQLYYSLLRQSVSPDSFMWLIVDDGSTDNTENLVKEWCKKSPFKISYFKQKNEGKMAKLNFIHNIIDTELCMCIDSDDYLTDDALSIIYNEWKKIKNRKEIAGMVGLDIYKNGDIVGTAFPPSMNKIKFSHFKKNKIKGDKKFIYRTAIIKSYPPYPSFEGERFPAPGYLYRLIDENYDLWIINKPLCIIEYLDDGLSKNKFGQFRKYPKSFMFYRKERMRLAISYSDRFWNAVHYVSSCIFARKNPFIQNKYYLTTILALPFGLLLNIYLRNTKKTGGVK